MNTRLIQCKILSILLLLLLISACNKPTYPKEKVDECVIKLCKNEYDLDVQVKIIGSTLGVLIPVEGLIDQDLKLNEKAGKKIENVALSIHRVTTSTDSPLKFYALTARDTKVKEVEFVLTGFIYDVVRVRLFDISRGEYFQRILRDFRFNTNIIGEKKIKEIFDGLNQNLASVQAIKPIFYPVYTIGKKNTQEIEIMDISSKELSDHEALLYVITKEYYEVQRGFEAYQAIFPSGFQNEYLFLIDISNFLEPVKEVVPKYFYANNEIRQRDLEETFEQYNDTGYIGIDGFPKRDMDTGWFLSQQLARRIKGIFENDLRLKKIFTVKSSTGLIENKVFKFSFSITKDKPQANADLIIFSKILKLVGTVLHRYSFEDYDGVELINSEEEGKKLYVSKEDLERFRRNLIKIQDLIIN